MDDHTREGPNLDHLAGGRVIAPTGLMRYVVIALLAIFIVVVMAAMAWLIVT